MQSRTLPSTIEKYGYKLRLVDTTDAEFILKLRTDNTLSNHLSETSPYIADQISWIENYKIRENEGLEFYFIAIGTNSQRLGTTRIYNLEEDCFEIGSWLFSKEAPLGAAILSDIIGREFGFENLGFKNCKFQVRKANSSVLKYHKSYKPDLAHEDDQNLYFTITKEKFIEHSRKLIKLLT